jgi:hypothetical protein
MKEAFAIAMGRWTDTEERDWGEEEVINTGENNGC